MAAASIIPMTHNHTSRRADLIAKRCELQSRSKPDLAIEHEAEPMSQTVATYMRNQAADDASRTRKTLADVEAALLRLDRGEYGICVICDDQISRKRLDAVPWAPLCIKCQGEEDVRAAARRLGVDGEE